MNRRRISAGIWIGSPVNNAKGRPPRPAGRRAQAGGGGHLIQVWRRLQDLRGSPFVGAPEVSLLPGYARTHPCGSRQHGLTSLWNAGFEALASESVGRMIITWLVRILRFFSITAVGLILGLGFWYASSTGRFQQWTEVPVKSQEIPDYIDTIAGQDPPLPPGRISRPCDYSSSEFSFMANPPRQIVDCIQRVDVYVDGSERSTHAIDSSGRVWEWRYGTTALEAVSAMPLSACSGLFIGMAAGFAIEAVKANAGRTRTAGRRV